jgi:hypothetical protein
MACNKKSIIESEIVPIYLYAYKKIKNCRSCKKSNWYPTPGTLPFGYFCTVFNKIVDAGHCCGEHLINKGVVKND